MQTTTATGTATTATLKVSAHYFAGSSYLSLPADTTRPEQWSVAGRFATVEEAQAVVALFPKSAKLQASRLYGDEAHEGSVRGWTKLSQDGVNGGVNEAGIKRFRSFIKAAKKAGVTLEWDSANRTAAYETQADFEAALAATEGK